MKRVPANAVATPAQGGPTGHDHGDGFEWEHLMPEINRASDPSKHNLGSSSTGRPVQ
jgi:hypothetical protein